MNTLTPRSADRLYRRLSGTSLRPFASTRAQSARLLALQSGGAGTMTARTPFWDDGLLDRLTQPLSRIRE